MRYAAPELCHDQEFVLGLVRLNVVAALQYAHPALRSHAAFIDVFPDSKLEYTSILTLFSILFY